jgi:hypothetical protein
MIHYDRAQLKVTETGEGFLKGIVTFAVPGVLPYFYGTTVRYEAKLPEDILSSKTIDSVNGIPVTDEHPYDKNGDYILVTPENYQGLVRGTLSNPRVENGEGIANITVYDSNLIKRIKSKEQYEVSMGFRFKLEDKPGILNGVHYDAIQRDIIANHLAITRDARAGDKTKIHVDDKNSNTRGIKMSKENNGAGEAQYSYRTFDGKKDLAVDSKEIFDEMIMLNKQIKADGEQIKDLTDKLAVATKAPKVDKEKELSEKAQLLADQNEELKKNYTDLEASIPAMVEAAASERVAILDSAKASGIEGKMDGLSNREIKLQLIAKHLPLKEGVKVDSMSDDAINARYDAAIDLSKMKANHVDTSQKRGTETRVDSVAVEEKRVKMQNMYKGGK